MSGPYEWLRRIASGLMLMATLAFLHQSAVMAVSQAVAATGLMPHPAVTLSGSFHLHGNHSGLVHFHGDNTPDHVHKTPDPHHHDLDESSASLFWSVGCSTAVIAIMETAAVSVELASALRGATPKHLEGVEPVGLQRPPSTPSIA